MTDRHFRTAFLDLVDGHGPLHPEQRTSDCATCRQAEELRSMFERELESGTKEMAPQSLPSGMLTVSTAGGIAWLPAVAPMAAALLVLGVAIAAPALFPMGMGRSPGSASPTASPVATPHPAVDIHRRMATEAQQPYFADGVIDAADYRAAVEATIACVRADGYHMNAELAEDGYYQYGGVDAPGLGDALDRCREEHSLQVERAFQEITGPSEDELPAVRAVLTCLRDAGRPLTSGTRPDQLRAFIEGLPPDDPARACAQSLPQE